MYIKLVREDWTDFYSGKYQFRPGGKVEVENFNPRPVCGGGIHYSKSLFSAIKNTNHNGSGRLIEIIPDEIEIDLGDKKKTKAVRVVRSISPTEWLETLSPDDADWWNRLLRAAKTDDWTTVFEFIE